MTAGSPRFLWTRSRFLVVVFVPKDLRRNKTGLIVTHSLRKPQDVNGIVLIIGKRQARNSPHELDCLEDRSKPVLTLNEEKLGGDSLVMLRG